MTSQGRSGPGVVPGQAPSSDELLLGGDRAALDPEVAVEPAPRHLGGVEHEGGAPGGDGALGQGDDPAADLGRQHVARSRSGPSR